MKIQGYWYLKLDQEEFRLNYMALMKYSELLMINDEPPEMIETCSKMAEQMQEARGDE
jgi:hypothetical protein